jgi:hypothetical protein
VAVYDGERPGHPRVGRHHLVLAVQEMVT